MTNPAHIYFQVYGSVYYVPAIIVILGSVLGPMLIGKRGGGGGGDPRGGPAIMRCRN